MMPFAENAYSYDALGLRVIPLCPPDHIGCARGHVERCTKPGKAPLVRWSNIRDVAPSPTVLEGWVRRWPLANIGMVAGQPSNVVVLDVDGEQGADSLRPFSIPETATALSARGPRLHLAAPENPLLTRVALLPGVDLQADGACAVLPPSRHLSGIEYTWQVPLSAGFAPCPDWLLELARVPRQPVNSPRETWASLWRGVPQGCRNETAARLAGWLLHRGHDADEVRELMLLWNLNNAPPLDEGELFQTVASIASRDAFRIRDEGLFGTGWVHRLKRGQVALYEALRAVERLRGYVPGSRLYVSHRELAQVSGYALGSIGGALRGLGVVGLIHYQPGKGGQNSDEASEVKRILPLPPATLAAK